MGLCWVLRPEWPVAEAQDVSVAPPVVPNPQAEAKTAAEMKVYTEKITGTEVTFDMVPIPGGEYLMGSPDSEAGRNPDEGPQHSMKIAPFWMGKCEVTWDEYDVWSFSLDVKRRETLKMDASDRDRLSDAVTRPTKPYTDMTFRMGHDGFPAICMTGLAARVYCEWLTAKTGRYYRLPTEAEWEYACRAGVGVAWPHGRSESRLGHYGWYLKNSDDHLWPVGSLMPNEAGLFDMVGNATEWCQERYLEYPRDDLIHAILRDRQGSVEMNSTRVLRGGSFQNSSTLVRAAVRYNYRPDDDINVVSFRPSRTYP